MSALDTINANGQDYDIMSPEVVSDYVEKIGTICKNPNGYTKGSLFLARDAQNVERMYKATSAIASNQTITSGTNCTVKKLGDLFNDVDSDVSQLKQALSDEVQTRSELTAHNLLFYDLAMLHWLNTGTWDNSGKVYTFRGVEYTVNDDMTISVKTDANGATDNSIFYLQHYHTTTNKKMDNPFVGKTITMSGCPSGGGSTTYSIRFAKYNATTNGYDYGSGKTFTVEDLGEAQIISYIGVYVLAGSVITTPITFKPMIRLATDADTTYRSYVPTNDELVSYRDNGIVGSKNLLPDSKSCTKFESSATGTTLVENSDGSITVANTDSSNHNLRRYFEHKLQAGEYILSTGANVEVTWNIYLSLSGTTTTEGLKQVGSIRSGIAETKLTLTKEDLATYPYMIINQNIGAGQSSTTYYPMLRIATDTDPTYAPFAMTNRELTEVAQQVESGYILATKGNYTSVSVTADGVKTYQTLLNELHVAINTYIAAHPDEYLDIIAIRFNSNGLMYNRQNRASYVLRNEQFTTEMSFVNMVVSTSKAFFRTAIISATLANCSIIQWTSDDGVVDLSSEIPSSGFNIAFNFDIYHKIS